MVSLREAIRRSESAAAADPPSAKIARQLYWSHINLGDVLGSRMRFSLGRPNEAAEHYRKARDIAERLVSADRGNEVAKLDLARAFGREGAALAASQPARALAALERSHSLARQISLRNHAGLELRLDCLITSVEPRVRLGDFERARRQLSEARRLLEEMRRAGVRIDEKSLHKAEAIRLYAGGHAMEAVEEARKQLTLLSAKPSNVLSENFETVELLDRIQMYAAGLDRDTCISANERLVRIWEELRSAYPRSAFVLGQAQRVLKGKGSACEHAARPVSPAPGLSRH